MGGGRHRAVDGVPGRHGHAPARRSTSAARPVDACTACTANPRVHGVHRQPAAGERAAAGEDDRVDAARRGERPGAGEQDPAAGGPLRADQPGEPGGQSQGAGHPHEEHGERGADRGGRWFTTDEPEAEHHQRHHGSQHRGGALQPVRNAAAVRCRAHDRYNGRGRPG
ncbi:hypothetical protein BJF90_03210 [Pseudonocardia sp. CNS-004]|nr:hypothetical protein BJF90_03210 [Pseudonocardia sp. CNS-004]